VNNAPRCLVIVDNESNKAFWNPKWTSLFLESFRGQTLSKNNVQWLDLAFHLWPPFLELPLAKTIQIHYDCMVEYFKLCLSSSLKNYYCFVQYMDNDNGDACNS
jgi:hypothetical protein